MTHHGVNTQRPRMTTVPLERPIPSPRRRNRLNEGLPQPTANSTHLPAHNVTFAPGMAPLGANSPQHSHSEHCVLSGMGGGPHYQPAIYGRVSKWNLKFSGLGSARVESFLNRLDECLTTCGQSFERQARYYNRHHRDERIAVGDVVRVRQHTLSRGVDRFSSKLARKYSQETYVVSKVISPVVYKLVSENNRPAGRKHVKTLRLVERALENDDIDE
ncbi:Protein of unknown function [Cotesia congregata]|uniref:Uncharacterized protein n=1 Tax=Cotesia congregata TaxID=51543 RepID=A0A8J2HQ56_COTCN|nr:Protein of unknown function [Cotesia congregata]